ncbi:HAD family hydrolase [Natronococcus occultus]|uniref:Putative phosphatase n=1 Tax=Natronococcus occultus SP4 TaxID=694430 RepID=L0K0L8_9EURY|nr:HAD family hydrolase [Natronococcus occultus]AGB38551.1 putative phosphatase [Natronococcus occultus SP4]
MSEYDAVVYDLDGTLVDLAVDWNAVAIDVIAVYARAAADPPSENLWELLEAASNFEIAPAVEETIADHEREGARRSRRLARADELLERPIPTGVCSLNCEAACRIALEEHELASAVDAVVGRDTVDTRKPDPEPLLETVRRLGAEASTALFVGDTDRDERTARRAGVDFEYVETLE